MDGGAIAPPFFCAATILCVIVPEYWSEAKERIVVDGKQRTLRRFGWSDSSEQDAFENAKERVADAVARARAGEAVRARDHKVPYNGAEGLPIREQIVSRHGDTVITRNSYGALCLNTPDIAFADVDVAAPGGILMGWVFSLFRTDPFDKARARIEQFAVDNPDWLLRLYRTPKGYRVLVMHRTFDADKEPAFEFLTKLGSDPLYMAMCRNQKCFRARVSPKPWRIGMEHIKPRPGVWPINPARMRDRQDWVRRYDEKSHRFASCRYEATLGSGRADRKCEAVRAVHDKHCKADQDLALA